MNGLIEFVLSKQREYCGIPLDLRLVPAGDGWCLVRLKFGYLKDALYVMAKLEGECAFFRWADFDGGAYKLMLPKPEVFAFLKVLSERKSVVVALQSRFLKREVL